MKVLVSGCFEILHGGHIDFFKQASNDGKDELSVVIAGDETISKLKNRVALIPVEHRKLIIENLSFVKEVFIADYPNNPVFNFAEIFKNGDYDALISTSDDKFAKDKKEFCESLGKKYYCLEKTPNGYGTSTTTIRESLKKSKTYRLRVDFAGAWLDSPNCHNEDSFMVNCTVDIPVSVNQWDVEIEAGLGGSTAYYWLNNRSAYETEKGWQDPVVIEETGLCSWRAFPKSKIKETSFLEHKVNPRFLEGKMALIYTGKKKPQTDSINFERDLELMAQAGCIGNEGVRQMSIPILQLAIDTHYRAQLDEGMKPLPFFKNSKRKYCGSGHGGYAVYLFNEESDREKFLDEYKDAFPVEPYIRKQGELFEGDI